MNILQGLNFILAIFYLYDSVLSKSPDEKFDIDNTVHKVSLTQKGYIQFLRYINDVPPLDEYTFCIWMRSYNLTHAHPLLSYSKHEEERLIRVWLSPMGKNLNLEILNVHIFKIPVDFVEHRWYHICQSWSSYQAAWNVYLNGKLRMSGIAPKLKHKTIKPGGDIVVGQEYTDFDKGLDDGIEGDIYGFNFVLSSTSNTVKRPNRIGANSNYQLRRDVELSHKVIPKYYSGNNLPSLTNSFVTFEDPDVPHILGYFNVPPNRSPKSFLDWDIWKYFQPAPTLRIAHNPGYLVKRNPIVGVDSSRIEYSSNRIINDQTENTGKPLGLQLVELGYNCAVGKGAPVRGKGVLISWTATPVRVFGGAILKRILPFCI